MSDKKYPFAVRLIGLSSALEHLFEAAFLRRQNDVWSFFCLPQDSPLQDPDFYIANGANMKALAVLSDWGVSDVRPALLVGEPHIDLPYPCVETPIQWERFFEELGKLVVSRADALSRLSAYQPSRDTVESGVQEGSEASQKAVTFCWTI